MAKLIELKIKDRLLFRRGEDTLGMVESPIISLELNDFGELALSIPKSHELYNSITINNTVIDLYIDSTWNWGFEVKSIDLDFDNTKIVYAKGIMSYLQHTIMRPFEYTGDISNFLTKLLDNHNNQVSNDKRIHLGEVTVFDKNNYINRSSGLYVYTWELLTSRLLKTHGGYFRIRKLDKYYLDYIQTYGTISNQPIRFAENMRDLIRYDSNTEVVNCLIPLGTELDEEGINGVTPRLTIESVNNGKDFIVNAESVLLYGEKWGTITFDDVTLPSNLLAKGNDSLKQLSVSEVSIEVKAIDLTNAGYEVDRWNIGDYLHCISEVHGLDTEILLSKMVIDLANPELDEYYLGRLIKGFKKVQSDNASDINRSIENVQTSTNGQISFVAEHITGARGGYKRDLFDDKGQTIGTAYMDAPNVESAKNVLLINQNGIAGTDYGFNGPYKLAITSDGIINADAIRAGTITGIRVDAQVGNIGNFEINDGILTYLTDEYDREYVWSDLSVIKNTIMNQKVATEYEKYIYDTNNDGNVTSADYVRIKNYLEGNMEKPKHPMIKTQILIGTENGEITSRVLFNGKSGYESNIYPDVANLHSLDVKGISLDGRSIESDSNGFLKIV